MGVSKGLRKVSDKIGRTSLSTFSCVDPDPPDRRTRAAGEVAISAVTSTIDYPQTDISIRTRIRCRDGKLAYQCASRLK